MRLPLSTPRGVAAPAWRGTLAWALGAGVLGVGLAAIITTWHLPDDGLALLLAATFLVALSMGVMGYALTRDIFSPLPPLAFVFIVLDVFRPLYILLSDRIGPTRRIDDESLTHELLRSMTGASSLILLALACLSLGYFSVHFASRDA